MALTDLCADKDKTDIKPNSDGLQRLIKDCNSDKFDAIII